MELKNTDEAVEEFMNLIVERAKQNLGVTGFAWLQANRRVNASGALRSGLFGKKIKLGERYLIEYYSRQIYGKFIEDGTRPSEKSPPVEMFESIMRWMKAKPVRLRRKLPKPKKFKRAPTVFAPQGDKALKSAAWAIATSRLRRGSKPIPYFAEAAKTESENPESILILEKGMAKDIEMAIFTAARRKADPSVVSVTIE